MVEIKPYLATVIEENGGIFSRNRPEARRAYGTQDLKRWAKFRGKPLFIDDRPTLSDPTPASFTVIAAYLEDQNWLQLTRALQQAFWVDAKDIGQSEVRRAVADEAGFNGQYLVGRENDHDVQAKWKSDRESAVDKGVFGFPTYIYDTETYWGRIISAFLRAICAEKPFNFKWLHYKPQIMQSLTISFFNEVRIRRPDKG